MTSVWLNIGVRKKNYFGEYIMANHLVSDPLEPIGDNHFNLSLSLGECVCPVTGKKIIFDNDEEILIKNSLIKIVKDSRKVLVLCPHCKAPGHGKSFHELKGCNS